MATDPSPTIWWGSQESYSSNPKTFGETECDAESRLG